MYKEKDDITEAEKDLLARVRKPSDRRDTGTTRLIRTFYGEGSDDSFAELLDEAEFDLDFQPHFDDATLYDAGSNNGFQSLHEILTRLPQILEHTAWFFDFREEQKQEALKEAPGLFTDNFEYSVEITHKAARWGNVFIYDKEAYYEGDILLVYFDDHGRVIRYYRVEGADDLSNAATMIDSGQDFMHGWWMAGHYGEDYEPHELAKRWREFEPENSKEGASVNVISEEQKL
ncbi:uncharacterized protein N7483_007949 [Penicillium malachiteum]|uniref:uncharacterized protein n=1 Tax=Penicillium malachiteum TaxID=1324776 RepID=UPI002546EF5C|nr:uncharacterized protein N7483_007949 [Penicillium malachiteum]KAJ5726592.1 hypothetical protein N7483_007949 [Penicillium malachiteum]